jgi:HEAT repeats
VTATVRRVLVAAMTGAALAPSPAVAQGRIANARSETRSAAQGLGREVAAVAARGGASWIGYRVPVIAGPRQMCCHDTVSDAGTCCGRCRLDGGSGVTMNTDNTGDPAAMNGSRVMLEAPTEFLVLVRVEGGSVMRLRTFTPDCDIDAGGMPVVWLNDVKPDDSVGWLTSLVTSGGDGAAAPGDREDSTRHQRVGKPAIAAIALHDGPAADRALDSFVAATRPEWLRSDTAFWLGSARGDHGVRVLTGMIAQDPSDRVREKAVFGLSVSRSPTALPTLISTAKDDKSGRVRGQALFWLAHKAGQQAVTTIANAITDDPDTEVKKKAVFALSQLPKDDGVPKLIEVARTNRNPEVRKQAMFWLGESKDPRAVKFFEEVLAR